MEYSNNLGESILKVINKYFYGLYLFTWFGLNWLRKEPKSVEKMFNLIFKPELKDCLELLIDRDKSVAFLLNAICQVFQA